MRPLLNLKWTKTGNYPAGTDAWSAQPLGVAPAGSYFTPNTKPAAEEFNYLFGTAQADLQALVDDMGECAVMNWKQPQGGSSTCGISNTGFTMDTISAACFDKLNGRWLVGGRDIVTAGDKYATMQTKDGANTWTKCGTNLTAATTHPYQFLVMDIMASPVLETLKLMITNNDRGAGGLCKIWKSVSDGAWSSVSTAPPGDSTAGRLQWLAGQYLAFIGSPTAPAILSSPDGTTWTARTIPAGVTAASDWTVCSTGTRVFAFSKTASLTKFAYSDDGITWSQGTIGIAAGDVVESVAAVLQPTGMVVVAAVHTGSNTQDIWNSLDAGATWTKVRTGITHLDTSGLHIYSMRGSGSILAAASQAGTILTIIFSPDAGVTWYETQTGIPSNGTGTGGFTENEVPPQLAASPTGFLWMNALWVALSFDQGLGQAL